MEKKKKIKQLLKNDEITKKVDKANGILGELGLKVGYLVPKNMDEWKKNNDKIVEIEGKLYTVETYKAIEKLKKD